ncbi:MAG: hypothetical protein AVDCRST_MAG21-685 [uncultured Nocardioidaceae bacterium]|uniref:HipA-like kinase domain-containing protein n=1 Tax=uncultured Nocardioidaceae bacterium TaxID=253824 RepID=A0A6J4MXB2_9ACTN|nr:MAG: hypothetical protein AVDCRST_MAG21-685 [uncultured Nocardioidaceae bacterium]
MLSHVQALRYVTPLREGGSLPGVVEADDLGTYVVKFRGAGQGERVLVAEVIATELARQLGLPVPRLVAVRLPEPIAKYEADEEVQDLLTASVGLNLGIDFLPGAFGFDSHSLPAPDLGAAILWFDALVANVDRSWRNPNLLVWHRQIWCIDHGASLYFHHAWPTGSVGDPERFSQQRYDASQHVLVGFSPGVAAAHERLAPLVTGDLLAGVVAEVPAGWLTTGPADQHTGEPPADVDDIRAAYVDHLLARVAHPMAWLPRAVAA